MGVCRTWVLLAGIPLGLLFCSLSLCVCSAVDPFLWVPLLYLWPWDVLVDLYWISEGGLDTGADFYFIREKEKEREGKRARRTERWQDQVVYTTTKTAQEKKYLLFVLLGELNQMRSQLVQWPNVWLLWINHLSFSLTREITGFKNKWNLSCIKHKHHYFCLYVGKVTWP